jgi:hypothetical protein
MHDLAGDVERLHQYNFATSGCPFEKSRAGLDDMVGQKERPHHYSQDDLPPDQVRETYGEQPTPKPQSTSDSRSFHVILLQTDALSSLTTEPAR